MAETEEKEEGREIEVQKWDENPKNPLFQYALARSLEREREKRRVANGSLRLNPRRSNRNCEAVTNRLVNI